MRAILAVGDTTVHSFTVTREKTVPFLYPESPEFQAIPEVFATGYMVGLMEWACILSLKPALEEGEGSLGTLIEVTHEAPTLPGQTVTVEATVASVDGRKVLWNVIARDELDIIGRGRIGRAVVVWDRFKAGLDKKAERLTPLSG
ncbi:thioesterase family protein [Rhizobiaceae bacterium BDR2-2]|uniref:Thioesterase family protein n=1 Tax=Ectorhizobium quercum TaxID=2965071 RepID=A0AAE3N226_9HYPH|nr:thioesterase family protein [Ectorhizobium quercum]MCX8997860.1 thioesterase family protein [Ectorhizobium quercum]